MQRTVELAVMLASSVEQPRSEGWLVAIECVLGLGLGFATTARLLEGEQTVLIMIGDEDYRVRA